MDKGLIIVLTIAVIAGMVYAYLEYTAEKPVLETGVLIEGGI